MWGGEEGRGGTGCRDRNVPVNDPDKRAPRLYQWGLGAACFRHTKVWICMGMVEVWKHLGSARSRTPQEGVRVERAKDGDPFEPRRSWKGENVRGLEGGAGGRRMRGKPLSLRSILPASPLSLAAWAIWGCGGTKPSHNSAAHLSAARKWTRGLILQALRMKSSQGRRPSPGLWGKKTPFSLRVIRKR